MLTKYIAPQNQANFANFKYKGGTDSITYKYIWSPLADYLVQFIPKHIAPNLITLFSLIILVITHLIFMIVGNNQEGVASWKLLLMAATIFAYLNLDNLDGKQARRTGSGSPLGMLFDHGTDAISSFLIAIQFLEVIQVQDGLLKIFGLFGFVMSIFFVAMWCQYSTGLFRLGLVNPVDQGLPLYSLLAVACVFFPYENWNKFFLFAKLNELMFLLFLVLVIFIIGFMTKDVFKQATRERGDILQVLILPLIYTIVLAALYFKDQNIFRGQITLPLIYVLMFSWSRNMIQLQVCFVAKQRFNPLNIGTFSFIVPSIIYLFYGKNTSTYFWITSFITFIVFIQFVLSVIQQGATILKIRVLSLEKRKET